MFVGKHIDMKKRLHYLLLTALALFGYLPHSKAQNLALDWVAHISGAGGSIIASSITVDREENVFSVGSFTDSLQIATKNGPVRLVTQSTIGLFIAKIDPSGTIEWIKSISGKGAMGSAGGNDFGMGYWFSIASDPNSNLYITGCYRDTVDFDPGPGQAMKTTRWVQTTGGSLGNPTLVTTFFENTFILKLDKNGEFNWVRTFPGRPNAAGGIAVDPQGGTISVTGYFKDTVDFSDGKGLQVLTTPKNAQHTFVAQYDSSGNFVWARQMGAGGNYDQGIGIHVDQEGFIYATGVFSDTSDYDPGSGIARLSSTAKPAPNSFVLKLDAKGNYVWAKAIGSIQANSGARGSGIATDPQGNVFTSGYFQRSGNFDPAGNPAYNITANSTGLSAYISKLDVNGNYVWAKAFSRPGATTTSDIENGLSIQSDEDGNAYIGGYFTGSLYLDPDQSNTNREVFQSGSRHPETFMLKLNKDGAFVWGKQFKSTQVLPGNSLGASLAKCVRRSPNNNFYASGYFVGTTDFNPSGTAYPINSFNQNARGEDGFVTKFICTDTSSTSLTLAICGEEYEFLGKTYYESGSYVEKIGNNSGCDSTIYLNLTLNPVVTPVINVNGFELGVAGTYKTYQWLYEGVPITGATSQVYTVDKNGAYRVVVSTNADCIDTSAVYRVTNYTGIGTQEYNTQVTIFPNPASETIFIKANQAFNVSLSSLDGRVLIKQQQTNTVSIKSISSGIYLLQLSDKDGNLVSVKKIIKE